ncbi:hypothetical protein ACFPIJ_54230 [Dactylosporangium cerinum]|uniref:Uncharacterized protein n=1 Tax=Dactylosporangium cerinum TaxID=1434730 RepID=A0ABV9WGQ4_9ACTN
MTVLFAEIADAGSAGFEDPQAEQAEQCDQGEVVRVGRQSGGGDQRFELQVPQTERGRFGWHGRPADVVGG